VTLERRNAQVLLPLIFEQSEDRAGTAGGAYWLRLNAAITAELSSQSPTTERLADGDTDG
jgi:hypothetical protein